MKAVKRLIDLLRGRTRTPAQQGSSLPSPPATRDPVDLLDFVYEDIGNFVRPDITTRDIEDRIQNLISETPAVPYFKGYRGYPSIASTPVNFEVVHTPPTNRRLKEGDILKMEFGLRLGWEHAFVGWTFPVGRISPERANILKGTHKALLAGLNHIRNGVRVGSISGAIENELQRSGLIPSREFLGYRIGQEPVMRPPIPCFGSGPVERTPVIKSGMMLAVIVIAHTKQPQLRLNPDLWTVHDVGHGDSAYFSALIRVTDEGYEQLNRFPKWTEPATL